MYLNPKVVFGLGACPPPGPEVEDLEAAAAAVLGTDTSPGVAAVERREQEEPTFPPHMVRHGGNGRKGKMKGRRGGEPQRFFFF